MSELTSLKFQCFQQSTVPNNYILLLDIGDFNLKNGSRHSCFLLLTSLNRCYLIFHHICFDLLPITFNSNPLCVKVATVQLVVAEGKVNPQKVSN